MSLRYIDVLHHIREHDPRAIMLEEFAEAISTAARSYRDWACRVWMLCAAALIILPVFVLSPVLGQDSSLPAGSLSVAPQRKIPAVLDEIIEAFRRGDAGAVVSDASPRVDVTIFGMSELFSRSQAGYVLHDFFVEFPPESFDITETSGSAASWFAAGRYRFVQGDAPLAIYFGLRHHDGAWKLKEVRIGRTINN